MDDPGRPLTDEVLAYIVRHPQAQDTVEGIAEWWLLEQQIHRAVSEVETALSQLMAKGFLIARRGGDGRTYYGLNRAKERDIRRHLTSAQAGQGNKPDPENPQD
ncbi:MAG: hypothetical protein JO015_21585 [Verrucomicrobia bacterium]|nr:hypothetical protein [Verrucomicrobiota bacterium]